MCGIAGIYDKTNAPSPSLVDEMVDRLEHRGPDERGVYLGSPLSFGMRRLSIIDLSSGTQPIWNEDRSIVIVFNGEIYNFHELRKRLLDLGHKFSTNSDTETVIHLYEEYGESCVDHLQGMFAFAIWEVEKEKLFIARDRFGIKPLFYHWNNDQLYFSSEIKSLFCAPNVSPSVDLQAINNFFTFLYVPADMSPFAGIKKLLPGHCLSLEKGNLEIKRYYQLPPVDESQFSATNITEAVDSFFETAQKIIKGHLISDVPLGAFLSGGIDSSLIVGIMSKLIDRPVDTFSIGYDSAGASFDERYYAKKVADLFGCNHRELVVTPDLVTKRLPELLNRLDEPYGDASVIPNYLLSEFAREHVTVALSGLGGDEICGGYERYLAATLTERFPLLSLLLANPISKSLANAIPDSRKGAHLPERLKRLTRDAALPFEQRYYQFIAKFNEDTKERLLKKSFLDLVNTNHSSELFSSYWERTNGFSELRRVLHIDLDTYLVDDLLALSDRTTMAHSLEMRVPFVDHKMVEYFWHIPDNLKIRGMNKKFLLKKAAERLLPKEIIYRKKTGFSVPLSVWFRDSLKPYLSDMLSEDTLKRQNFFDVKYVQTLMDEHFKAKRNHDEKLFALLSFTVWHDSFFN